MGRGLVAAAADGESAGSVLSRASVFGSAWPILAQSVLASIGWPVDQVATFLAVAVGQKCAAGSAEALLLAHSQAPCRDYLAMSSPAGPKRQDAHETRDQIAMKDPGRDA